MSNKKLIGNFVLVTYTSRCIVGHEYLRPYLPSVHFQFLCFFFHCFKQLWLLLQPQCMHLFIWSCYSPGRQERQQAHDSPCTRAHHRHQLTQRHLCSWPWRRHHPGRQACGTPLHLCPCHGKITLTCLKGYAYIVHAHWNVVWQDFLRHGKSNRLKRMKCKNFSVLVWLNSCITVTDALCRISGMKHLSQKVSLHF